jgi:hypothetical protein
MLHSTDIPFKYYFALLVSVFRVEITLVLFEAWLENPSGCFGSGIRYGIKL